MENIVLSRRVKFYLPIKAYKAFQYCLSEYAFDTNDFVEHCIQRALLPENLPALSLKGNFSIHEVATKQVIADVDELYYQKLAQIEPHYLNKTISYMVIDYLTELGVIGYGPIEHQNK